MITFTTHKTLLGPRGAVILTDSPAYAKKIDKAVFPGEQGGPHINAMAAMAVTFKIAQSDAFKELQGQIIKNAKTFANQLMARGLRVPYNGTDSHMALLDTKSIKAGPNVYLSGDMGARILDVAGIVANRNTIPGDRSAFSATGIRFGSPWLTQRGFKEAEFHQVADIIADLFAGISPYNMPGGGKIQRRAKVDFKVLEDAKLRVAALAEKADNVTQTPAAHGYPHFFDISDDQETPWASFKLSGDQIRHFVTYAFDSDVEALQPGETQPTTLHTANGAVEGFLLCQDPFTFVLTVQGNKAGLASAWLRDLSDAYTKFDPDLVKRLPGPMAIEDTDPIEIDGSLGKSVPGNKPYYIGIPETTQTGEPLPKFNWQPAEEDTPLTTPLNCHSPDIGRQDGTLRRMGYARLVFIRCGRTPGRPSGSWSLRCHPHGRLSG